MARRFVFCKFAAWERRSYAWHCDDDTVILRPGMSVEVPVRDRETGALMPQVLTVDDIRPAGPQGVDTQPIIRVLR